MKTHEAGLLFCLNITLRKRHSITVDAMPEKVYEAFWQLDMAESNVIKALLKMRGAYGLIFKGKPDKQPSLALTIQDMMNSGFILLSKTLKTKRS